MMDLRNRFWIGCLVVAFILVMACAKDPSKSASSESASSQSASSDSTSSEKDARATKQVAASSETPDHKAENGTELTYHGIDVSHHQNTVDWTKVKAAGKVFVFMKASEGDDWTDPNFANYWQGSGAAGLVRGAYHYFRPKNDAKAQAELFLATVSLSPGDLAPALDIEVTDGVTPADVIDDIQIWLDTVEKALGIRPILYSDENFLKDDLVQGAFGEYPLWLAEYGTEESPAAPDGWERWTFWQSTQQGHVDGIEGAVDLSMFKGTAEGWRALRLQADQR